MSAAQRVSRGFHRLGLFLAAICIIWPTACLAQDIVVSGVGAFSCGQLAQDYSTLSDVEAVWFTWAQGFMSGLNMKMGIDQHQYRNLGAMTVEEQKRFLRNFCDQHPLKNFLEAVTALWAGFPAGTLPVDDAQH
jgi:hypothetical protein